MCWSFDQWQVVLSHVGTFRALEVMYTYSPSSSGSFWERVWQSLGNAKALRNRLKLVKTLVRNALERVGEGVTLLSLGSGSGRALLEVLAEAKPSNVRRVVFVDLSRDALEAGKELAKQLGVDSAYQLDWYRNSVQDLTRFAHLSPTIIEMVGLLDYFPAKEAVCLLSNLYQILAPSGIFIVGNVRWNEEALFVERAVGWHLIYREPEEIFQLLREAGFPAEGIRIYYEPMQIHGVAYCVKGIGNCAPPDRV